KQKRVCTGLEHLADEHDRHKHQQPEQRIVANLVEQLFHGDRSELNDIIHPGISRAGHLAPPAPSSVIFMPANLRGGDEGFHWTLGQWRRGVGCDRTSEGARSRMTNRSSSQ